MDFLEGFLIGPVWSDTDYRSRRHLNAHTLLATLMAVGFVALALFPERFDSLILFGWPTALFLLILLILVSPALSIFYRRLPYYARPLLLLVYAAKYILLFYILVHAFYPKLTFEKESLLELLYARVDDHIGRALEKIAVSGGILVTVGGVIAGGLWVIAEGLALIAILILVPLFSIAALKCLQYGYDRATKALLDKQLEGIPYLLGNPPLEDPAQGGGEELEEAEELPEPVPSRILPEEEAARDELAAKPSPAWRGTLGQMKLKAKGFWGRLTGSLKAGRIKGWVRRFGAFLKESGKKSRQWLRHTGSRLKMRAGRRRPEEESMADPDRPPEESGQEEEMEQA